MASLLEGLVMGEGHRYTLDSVSIPSVTQVVGMSYYEDIAQDAGLPAELCSPFNPEREAGFPARKGSAVHAWIDGYLGGLKPLPLSDGFGGPETRAFMKWLVEKKPDIRLREQKVLYKDLWFCGTMDCLEHGRFDIVRDYKTGKHRLMNELQLGGYSLAVKEMGIAMPEEAELLYLGLDGNYYPHRVDSDRLLLREEQFLNLRKSVLTLRGI
jgi:hypothetical protein